MKIKLKFQNDIAKSLGVSACVITKDFSFSSALLQAVMIEGNNEDLDEPNAPYKRPPSPTPSSPLSSPPPSPPTSPLQPIQRDLPPTEPLPGQGNKKRSKNHSKANRKRQRTDAAPRTAAEIPARSNPVGRFVPSGSAFQGPFSMKEDAPVASTSYVGLRDTGEIGEGRTWRLDELVGPRSKHNFELIRAVPGTTVPIVDVDRRVTALVVYPADPSLLQATQEAANLLRNKRKEASFAANQEEHRRGKFAVLGAGITHGNGRLKPGNILQSKTNTAVLNDIINSSPFQRLSGFATGVLKSWAPKLYNYCSEKFERLLASDDSLIRLFSNSVMSTAAFNLGPRTICLPHIDFSNLPFLWCFIWALGWYNWRKGGHIILWDLKVVIEFPPGSLVAIPSGVCRHSNTRIRNNETRYSFTQYSSGGNFRWVDHGFMSEEVFAAKMSATEAEEEEIRKHARWEMGLNLFSTLDDLGLST